MVTAVFLRPKDNGMGKVVLHVQFFFFAVVSELSKAYENCVMGYYHAALFALVRLPILCMVYRVGLRLRTKAAGQM